MKARIKATGNVYRVLQYTDCETIRYVELYNVETKDNIENKYGSKTFPLDEVELLNDTDMPSEQRMRYELAKAAMQGIVSNSERIINGNAIEENSYLAISYADEMIKQLK